MRILSTAAAVCLFGVMLCPMSMAEQIYLYADFNDKAIDAPIGTAGAAAGEPIEVDPAVTAIVREGPMGSPSLEIQDASGTLAAGAIFEFLDGIEISSGFVNISADLWFHALTTGYTFTMYVRESGGSAKSFGTLYFHEDGWIGVLDANGYTGSIGTFEPGRLVRLILEYDMGAGTYDVWLDGTLALDDRAHGVADRGIGSVHFGSDYDEDLEGYFNVDVVSVTDYFQAVATEEYSWGRVKAAYR